MKSSIVAFTLLCMSASSLLWLRQASFEATPAVPGTVPSVWPGASSIVRQAGVPTLILFAHPCCPCTRATLRELAAVLELSIPQPSVYVLFTRPGPSVGELWSETENWRQASQITGATVAWDDDGREAARFGARSSGHLMLFDGAGNLRFDGGITTHRGEAGVNGFRNTLVDMLKGRGGLRRSSPVFGCSLVLPE